MIQVGALPSLLHFFTSSLRLFFSPAVLGTTKAAVHRHPPCHTPMTQLFILRLNVQGKCIVSIGDQEARLVDTTALEKSRFKYVVVPLQLCRAEEKPRLPATGDGLEEHRPNSFLQLLRPHFPLRLLLLLDRELHTCGQRDAAEEVGTVRATDATRGPPSIFAVFELSPCSAAPPRTLE